MSGTNAPSLIGSAGDSLREAFGRALTSLAPEYPQLVVLDADIAGGTGVHHFRKAYPERFLQFGIAEQNMMAAAGGLAAVGMLPVVTTFAVFCLRAIEQARLSIAYAKRNVKIVASHPGLDVGPDGGSAQALEDIAAFRAIPGMTVISPADPFEIQHPGTPQEARVAAKDPEQSGLLVAPQRLVLEPGERRCQEPALYPLIIDALSLKAASARSGRPGAGRRSHRCTAFATRRCRTETRCLAPLWDRAARRRISRP